MAFRIARIKITPCRFILLAALGLAWLIPSSVSAAPKTFYFRALSSTVVSANANMVQLSETPGSADNTGTSILHAKNANTWQFVPNVAGNTTTLAIGATPNSQGWIWDGAAGGGFAAAPWTIDVDVVSVTADGTAVIKAQVWKVTANPTTVTQVTNLSGILSSASFTPSTSQARRTLSFTPGAITLNANEYLYVEVYLTMTVAAGGNGSAMTHVLGSSNASLQGRIVTSEFTPPTNIGNGTDPSNSTVGPGGTATMLDAFTFQTVTGTDTITAVTVSFAAGMAAGVGLVEITNDAGSVVYGSFTNPADTQAIPLTTSITATTTATPYKIRITPKSHAAMPAPPGAAYAVTGTVSTWTGTNPRGGSDTGSATVTIDNLSPGEVSGVAGTPDVQRILLSWTKPGDSDLASILALRRAGSPVGDVPVEGASYAPGASIGSSTVACNASGATCTDSGLTNGSAYYYKLFTRDTFGNYSPGLAAGPFTPNPPAAPIGFVFDTDPANNPDPTTQINMYWTDNSINEVSFSLERAPSDGTCDGIGEIYALVSRSTLPVPGMNPILRNSSEIPAVGGLVYAANTGLIPNSPYCYRVKANSRFGSSTYLYSAPKTTSSAGPDSTAPAAVTDMAVVAGGQRYNSIDLFWTAPGDDGGVGQAARYDLRFSMTTIADPAGGGQVDWSTVCTNIIGPPLDATRPTDCTVKVVNLVPPRPAGSLEYRTLTGRINTSNECDVTLTDTARPVCLRPNTLYYYALKTEDEVPNISAINTGGPVGGDNLTNGQASGRTALRTGLNLVSVPRQPQSPNDTPTAVFGDDIGGPPFLSIWTSSGLGTTAGCYAASPTAYSDCSPQTGISTVAAGQGYFLFGGGNNPVLDVPSDATDVGVSTICGLANAAAIPLQLGWNIIGNPFSTGRVPLNDANAAVRKNAVCSAFSAAVGANDVGAVAYVYNGATYDTITNLEPWKGYWFQVVNNNVYPSANTFELILKKP